MYRQKTVTFFLGIFLVLLAGCGGEEKPSAAALGKAAPPAATKPTPAATPSPPAAPQAPAVSAPPPAAAPAPAASAPPAVTSQTSAAPQGTPASEKQAALPQPGKETASVPAALPTAPATPQTVAAPPAESQPPAPALTKANPSPAQGQAAAPVEASGRQASSGVNRAQTSSLRGDGIHDPNNPALATMQNPSQSLSVLPLGKWGEIDWMQALARNTIRPRANLKNEGKMEVLDLDIIMSNTKSMPHVRFPHNSHTQWLACSNCHPKPFVQQKGGNPMTMDAILKGQFCGVCHGKVSFSTYICQRCHSVVHEGSPDKWW
ncbi:MAG: hypothetical protein HQL88_01485 [Magnetococcales bacterium]|nr:hypothetical protein [Magnetococcales bacterium]